MPLDGSTSTRWRGKALQRIVEAQISAGELSGAIETIQLTREN